MRQCNTSGHRLAMHVDLNNADLLRSRIFQKRAKSVASLGKESSLRPAAPPGSALHCVERVPHRVRECWCSHRHIMGFICASRSAQKSHSQPAVEPKTQTEKQPEPGSLHPGTKPVRHALEDRMSQTCRGHCRGRLCSS